MREVAVRRFDGVSVEDSRQYPVGTSYETPTLPPNPSGEWGLGLALDDRRCIAGRVAGNVVHLMEVPLDNTNLTGNALRLVFSDAVLHNAATLELGSISAGGTDHAVFWLCCVTAGGVVHRLTFPFEHGRSSDWTPADDVRSVFSPVAAGGATRPLPPDGPALAAEQFKLDLRAGTVATCAHWGDAASVVVGTSSGSVFSVRLLRDGPPARKELSASSTLSRLLSGFVTASAGDEGVVAVVCVPGGASSSSRHPTHCVALHANRRLRCWDLGAASCVLSHQLSSVLTAGTAGVGGISAADGAPAGGGLVSAARLCAVRGAAPSATTLLLQVLADEATSAGATSGPAHRLRLELPAARLYATNTSPAQHFTHPLVPAPSVGDEMQQLACVAASAGVSSVWTAWQTPGNSGLGVVVHHRDGVAAGADAKAVVPLWADRVQLMEVDWAGPEGSADFKATSVEDAEVFYLSRVFLPDRYPLRVIMDSLRSYSTHNVDAWGPEDSLHTEDRLKVQVAAAVRGVAESYTARVPAHAAHEDGIAGGSSILELASQRHAWREFLELCEKQWRVDNALLGVVQPPGGMFPDTIPPVLVLRRSGVSVLRLVDASELVTLGNLTAFTRPDEAVPGWDVRSVASALAGLLPTRVLSRLDSLSRSPDELSAELVQVAREYSSHVLDWVSEVDDDLTAEVSDAPKVTWNDRHLTGLTGPWAAAYATRGANSDWSAIAPRHESTRDAFVRAVLRAAVRHLFRGAAAEDVVAHLGHALDALDPRHLSGTTDVDSPPRRGAGASASMSPPVPATPDALIPQAASALAGGEVPTALPSQHAAAVTVSVCQIASARRALCRDLGLLAALLSETDVLVPVKPRRPPTLALPTTQHAMRRATLLCVLYRTVEWCARQRVTRPAAPDRGLRPLVSQPVALFMDGGALLHVLFNVAQPVVDHMVGTVTPFARGASSVALVTTAFLSFLTFEPVDGSPMPLPLPASSAWAAPPAGDAGNLPPPTHTSFLVQFLLAAKQHDLLRQVAANRVSWSWCGPQPTALARVPPSFLREQRRQYVLCVALADLAEARRLAGGNSPALSAALDSAVAHFHQAAPGSSQPAACGEHHLTASILLERAGFSAAAIPCLEAAIAWCGGDKAPLLWSRLFAACVDVEDYDRAFLAVQGNPDAERRRDSFRRLVLVMCERRQLRKLCALPLTPDHIRATSETVLWKAWTAEIGLDVATGARVSGTQRPADVTYYHLLYAFLTYKQRHRMAAACMWALAERLTRVQDAVADSAPFLEQLSSALAAAVGSLSLVPTEQAFLRRWEWWPAAHAHDIGGVPSVLGLSFTSTRPPADAPTPPTDSPDAVSLADMRRCLAVATARFEASRVAGEGAAGGTPAAVQTALLEHARFERSASLTLAARDTGYLARGTLEPFAAAHLPPPHVLPATDVVKALVRTVYTAGRVPTADDDDDVPPAGTDGSRPPAGLAAGASPSTLPLPPGVTLGCGGSGTGLSRRRRCERLLCDYLRMYDGPLTNFKLHHCAVSTMLAEFPAVELPLWLTAVVTNTK